MKPKKLRPSQISQMEARGWLIHNGLEGAEFWKRQPLDTDFRDAMQQDLRDFGSTYAYTADKKRSKK